MQQQVRYVAVEIGIGGYQPHPATQVFNNRYGDCKDKVTLLRTMLRDVGIESNYVLVHTSRGMIDPAFATTTAFNHVIIAIRLPSGVPLDHLYATAGRLLLFDPTSSLTPVGYLPEELQGSRGLLVNGDGGELIDLPSAPPPANQLRRRAKLKLDDEGTLTGEVEETRTGSIAAGLRAALQPLNEKDRIGYIETSVAAHVADFNATDVTFENLNEPAKDFVVRYKVSLPRYAKHAGNMTLVRPRVIGAKWETIVDAAHRKYDYVTDGPSQQSDDVEITNSLAEPCSSTSAPSQVPL